jgi:hypothetical protein
VIEKPILTKMKITRIVLITLAIISIVGLIIVLSLNDWSLSNNLAGIYLMIFANICTFTAGILSIISDTRKEKIK